ncbi:adenylate synthase [Pseudomonas sp. CCI3.2]|uniref:F390 synthetase-related protein n=1 Tax=unclassified Pseudomonas TaxID=196821 RepID=UPI002AC8F961|nr:MULTISPECIES: F390 synthetase-related protein [unclassified Pseudomonas]MEB0079635.1 adenylate synthase [Pseudomonas sp. MH10out]MEB0103425.1 adenylate synthase [Pseudomonas sp. CCI3.2]MEB0132222.1 adenylate synthase [Pseudomonas sp. CCI2.4]MEB0157816.1 adenylate synthase [Pseudomonas sp. AH2 (2023)]MEB0169337.1 adenylate synthase [Pseudomonas sp. CCC4.4]
MKSDRLIGAARAIISFIHSRYCLRFNRRDKLEAWQARRLKHFIREILPTAGRFKELNARKLADLPLMDKATLMGDFSAFNTRGLNLAHVWPLARRAEDSRDFSPTLDDITVGLSSGTSGSQGVFLVSDKERQRWAGILLARTLPRRLLPRLICPWLPPLRIAFFLRANSRLYTTLVSRRIDFAFHDMILGLEASLLRLTKQNPDVLVAPATVLRGLAEVALAGHLTIHPKLIFSVAEVLEDADAQAVKTAFGIKPQQIYQATEGFLGYTCEAGTLHLNESHLHIEPDWLDAEQTRFQPIITDFSRRTQLIVRYRLNDILRIAAAPCVCGRAERAISAVEGRADEILWLPSMDNQRLAPLYPDVVRRTLLMLGPTLEEYDITQYGMHWQINLRTSSNYHSLRINLSNAIEALCEKHALQCPNLSFGHWQRPLPHVKRCRLKMIQSPEGLPCMY